MMASELDTDRLTELTSPWKMGYSFICPFPVDSIDFSVHPFVSQVTFHFADNYNHKCSDDEDSPYPNLQD